MKRAIGIIILLFVQVTILSNIHLFGVATPLVLVYCFIVLPVSAKRHVSLALAFVLGLVSDIFSNTPGVSAATLTFVAFVQPYLLRLFVSRETERAASPSMVNLGVVRFLAYSFLLTLLACAGFFLLAVFNFADGLHLLLDILASTVLSFFFVLTFETFRLR